MESTIFIDELSFMKSESGKLKVLITEKKVYDVPDEIGEKIFDLMIGHQLRETFKNVRPFAESIKAEKFEDRIYFRYNKQTGISEKIEAEQLKNELDWYWNTKVDEDYEEDFRNYIDGSANIGDSYETNTHVYCVIALGNFDI